MSSENTVNSQIVDSVSAASTLLVAQGPAQSFSMLDMVMLETLGTAMHNAVARQQGAGMVSNAAVTATCAKMINAPWPVPPPAPEPPPPPPPQVIPLPGPVPAPPSPAAVIAAATAEGKTAISVLQAQTHGATADAAAATSSLHALETLAGNAAAPAPGPAPDPSSGPDPDAGPAQDSAPDSPSSPATGNTDAGA
ncbi:RebB family R body protein [Stenotrophomonas geniculata]|uniref:RebB family R body protein n=1 Tax=Stenotrophomonas TaxID=40323 RepID=UPI003D340391